ncbi:MAG: hypothetical protein Q8K60_07135 [Parachlamydiaceae bacterium]|nr:hypothetical protein [Parachlamydiaceae bacterium]
MKKLLFGLIASLSFVSTTHAITSNLNQSINIYESILTAINPLGTIGQNEFIVDIVRTTPGINYGWNVHYNIKTIEIVSDLLVDTKELNDEEEINAIEADHSHHSCSHHHNHEHVILRTYDAVLSVLANPAIGPPVVTVKSIKLISTNERHLI